MKVDPYLHAVLVLHGAGKEITKDNIKAVLSSAGAQADEARAKVLSEAVTGVNFDELLAQAALAPAAAAPAAGKADEKKKEAPEDSAKKEEAAAEGLASLFG